MSMNIPNFVDGWLLQPAPQNEVVVSSRARLARNLPHVPFAPHASQAQLDLVADQITKAFREDSLLGSYERWELDGLETAARSFLRESYLISAEQEKGGVGRLVFLSPDFDASIMINEEDHLRISTLVPGFQIAEAYERIRALEEAAEGRLALAWSEELGYLTACPTNTGTGLRLSVMVHLPALAMIGQVEETLSNLTSFGLIVRGSYGEHSDHHGDLFQISNEVTLGKSEAQITQTLHRVVQQIVDRELRTREMLHREANDKLQDAVCRALGLLASARSMNSQEAAVLLSRARLGVGQPWGTQLLDHPALSRLFVEIQPAHLQVRHEAGERPEQRDVVRAEILRKIFKANGN